MLAPQCLALEPGSVEAGAAVVVSGSSDPGLRRWRIGREGGELVPWAPAQVRKESAAGKQAAKSPVKRLVVHDTSVYHVAFDLSDYDDDEDGAGPSLWTASADGTAKLISATGAVEETLQHGDYVRAIATTDHWVLTAGRTEDVKVWDKTGGELKFVLEGHYDEVTDLVVLEPALAAGVAERGRPLERLVSVGLDGTVRTWLLDEPALEEEVKKQADAKRLAKEGGNAGNNDGENKQAGVGLTAEEEAELAALMDEDDE